MTARVEPATLTELEPAERQLGTGYLSDFVETHYNRYLQFFKRSGPTRETRQHAAKIQIAMPTRQPKKYSK